MFFLLVILFLLLPRNYSFFWKWNPQRTSSGFKDESDPDYCVACTLITRLLQEFLEWHKLPCVSVIKDLCLIIPDKYQKWRDYCDDFVEVVGPAFCALIEEGVSPDRACRKIHMCDGWEQCTLYVNKTKEVNSGVSEADILNLSVYLLNFRREVARVTKNIVNGNDVLIPPEENDPDEDWFSDYFYMRGTSWRGKDCDNSRADIYPGRKSNPGAKGIDYNCNGIFGIDEKTGVEYEELLCNGTERRGYAVIGDSACAHFHIPEVWFSPNVTLESLAYIFPLIENECGFPHLGGETGYMNDTTGLSPGDVFSTYLHLREKNHCNHRDFQNVCHNGGNSWDVPDYVKYIRRSEGLDHPISVFITISGMDVCSPRHGFEHMTKPEQFHDNIVKGLQQLDTQLPKGSHVVVYGLPDGTFLWDTMAKRIHPLGCTYEDLYNYLNCLGDCPCWGWCNSNKTVRDMTQKRADELSEQFVRIVDEMKFQNFDLYFVNSTKLQYKGLKKWIEEGHDPADFVEAIDGFHPSQNTERIALQIVVEELDRINPKILGDVNPNNHLIKEIFGDQGGY